MPNFFVFVRSFQVLPRRIALFATLLIAALALSVYQVPQQPEYSRVIYSQDISLLTELPAHQNRLDYLLLAQPLPLVFSREYKRLQLSPSLLLKVAS
jgi:hypothetical protein